MSGQDFWNKVYSTKSEKELSWFQEVPKRSLELIQELPLHAHAQIIDIGGGDSRLADSLLHLGFDHITVLDLSSMALLKAQERLKDQAAHIEFIASDITTFHPAKKYDLWHDRAAFHFLTESDKVEKYVTLATQSVALQGYLILITFSKQGPEKCSGLPIVRYSAEELSQLFNSGFELLRSFEDVHMTPWGSQQAFVYCCFKKRI
jgi:predicted TPR repeat methyltransferase